jgi:hypothetical protein
VFDWVTISALATAGGTLILSIATFASVRSANRTARAAEQALLVGLRPVLITRFSMTPREDGTWLATVSKHWNIDRRDPR